MVNVQATYALDQGDIYSAYELYLSAGLYNPAHDLAVLELSPDAVVRRDLDLLKTLFERFEPAVSQGQAIDGWHVRGKVRKSWFHFHSSILTHHSTKVFLDYAHIMTRLPELYDEQQLHSTDAVPDAAHAAEVEELTRRASKIIGILPDVLRNGKTDARHKAALAEMTGGLVGLVDRLRPLGLVRASFIVTIV